MTTSFSWSEIDPLISCQSISDRNGNPNKIDYNIQICYFYTVWKYLSSLIIPGKSKETIKRQLFNLISNLPTSWIKSWSFISQAGQDLKTVNLSKKYMILPKIYFWNHKFLHKGHAKIHGFLNKVWINEWLKIYGKNIY